MKQIVRIADEIFLITASIPQIGYYARNFTLGKELDFVKDYIARYTNRVRIPANSKMVIFLEPQIDTGYPDIVIITYRRNAAMKWDDKKRKITSNHLKVLFEIDRRKRVSIQKLSQLLGYDSKAIKGFVDDLVYANMASRNSVSICRKPYREYYCIKKTIAIEAKIDKWSEAIEQALHNTRFSDESYILMNKEKCRLKNATRCNELGVGVILLNGKIENHIKPRRNPMPGSYLSFLFNNWIMQIDALLEVQ